MTDALIISAASRFKAAFRKALAEVPRGPDLPPEYLVGIAELDRLSGGRTDTVESATKILRNLEVPLASLGKMERKMKIKALRKCIAAHRAAIKELKGAGAIEPGG